MILAPGYVLSVCPHVFVHVHIVYACVCVCVCVRVQVCVQGIQYYVCVCMYICVCACMHSCMCTCMYMCCNVGLACSICDLNCLRCLNLYVVIFEFVQCVMLYFLHWSFMLYKYFFISITTLICSRRTMWHWSGPFVHI